MIGAVIGIALFIVAGAVMGYEIGRQRWQRQAAEPPGDSEEADRAAWKAFVASLRGDQPNGAFWRDLERQGNSPAFRSGFMASWHEHGGEESRQCYIRAAQRARGTE